MRCCYRSLRKYRLGIWKLIKLGIRFQCFFPCADFLKRELFLIDPNGAQKHIRCLNQTLLIAPRKTGGIVGMAKAPVTIWTCWANVTRLIEISSLLLSAKI